jgi:hypothetical protein
VQDLALFGHFDDALISRRLCLERRAPHLRYLMEFSARILILGRRRDFPNKPIAHHLFEGPVESAWPEAHGSIRGLLHRIGNTEAMLNILGKG